MTKAWHKGLLGRVQKTAGLEQWAARKIRERRYETGNVVTKNATGKKNRKLGGGQKHREIWACQSQTQEETPAGARGNPPGPVNGCDTRIKVRALTEKRQGGKKQRICSVKPGLRVGKTQKPEDPEARRYKILRDKIRTVCTTAT